MDSSRMRFWRQCKLKIDNFFNNKKFYWQTSYCARHHVWCRTVSKGTVPNVIATVIMSVVCIVTLQRHLSIRNAGKQFLVIKNISLTSAHFWKNRVAPLPTIFELLNFYFLCHFRITLYTLLCTRKHPKLRKSRSTPWCFHQFKSLLGSITCALSRAPLSSNLAF